jgi:hypothetical protein
MHCSVVPNSLPNLSYTSPPAGHGFVAVNLKLLLVDRMIASKPGFDSGIAAKIFLPYAKAGVVKVWQALCVTALTIGLCLPADWPIVHRTL